MNHYRKLVFNHANLNRPVHIVAGTIAAYHYSAPTECNVVYTTAGVFPVSESLEQIDQMIENLNSPEGQGEKNERPATKSGNTSKRKARP